MGSNPVHVVSASGNIYSWSTSCQFCVSAEKYLLLMRGPGSVNEKVAQAELHNTVPAHQQQ